MSSDRQGQRRPSPGFGMMPDGHSPDTPHSGTIPIAAGRTARRDLVSLDAEGAMRETRGSIARSQESLARSSGYLGRNRAFTSSGMRRQAVARPAPDSLRLLRRRCSSRRPRKGIRRSRRELRICAAFDGD